MLDPVTAKHETIHGLDFGRYPDEAIKYAMASVVTKGVGLLKNALFFTRDEAERVSTLRGRMYGDQNLSYPNIGMDPAITKAIVSMTASMNKLVMGSSDDPITCTTKEIRNWNRTDIPLHQDDTFQEQALVGTGGVRALSKVLGPRSSLHVVTDNRTVHLNTAQTGLEPSALTRIIVVPYVPGGVILLPEDIYDGMPVTVDDTLVRSEHPAHGGWQENGNTRDVFTMDFELPFGGSFHNLGIRLDDVRLHHAKSNRYLIAT